MTIGNRDTAAMLYNRYTANRLSYPRAPKGFRRVGEGCYRVAVLEVATDTVYKIGDYEANVTEAYNSRRLARKSTKSLGFELRIPKTRTFSIPGFSRPARVSAQEFARGARPTFCNLMEVWYNDNARCTCKRGRPDAMCWKDVHEQIMDFSGLTDIHSENVLMDRDEVFWFIDMAD